MAEELGGPGNNALPGDRVLEEHATLYVAREHRGLEGDFLADKNLLLRWRE